MLAGAPLALGFDVCAVFGKVQRSRGTAIRQAPIQRLLAAAKGAKIWCGPVRPALATFLQNQWPAAVAGQTAPSPLSGHCCTMPLSGGGQAGLNCSLTEAMLSTALTAWR